MFPYQDPSLTTEERAEDLLRRMTLHEKIGQLKSNDGKEKVFTREGDDVAITEEA